jgi:hypothetical protein
MKRLVISAAIIGSAFIFTSCATNNAEQASNTPQASPFAQPSKAVLDDTGYNRWPLTFDNVPTPGTDLEQ